MSHYKELARPLSTHVLTVTVIVFWFITFTRVIPRMPEECDWMLFASTCTYHHIYKPIAIT